MRNVRISCKNLVMDDDCGFGEQGETTMVS